MADTVDTLTVFSGKRLQARRFTNESDGTGESGVTKIDISTFTDGAGRTATYSTIDRIAGHVSGFNYVVLVWDADTDDEIAVLRGNFDLDYSQTGGITDPRSTGTTGDVKATTDGAFDGASYDITVYFRPKAA